ncbi:TPA: membrane integrity-associated transporter subunit PqiC [Raoultella planticola]
MKTVLSLLLGVSWVLAGCASPQVRYHTLVNADPVSRAVAAPDFVIDLLPVGVPAQLDTQQVVVRQSDSRVVVLDNDRWLSPLGDEWQAALSLSITQRFNTVDVGGLARDTGKPVVRVLMQVRRFDSWPGNAVTLDADWSLSTQREGKSRRLVCKSHLSQPLAGDPAQMFTAWQRVVERLASQIGQTATDWVATGTAACLRD